MPQTKDTGYQNGLKTNKQTNKTTTTTKHINMLSIRNSFRLKDTSGFKVSGWKIIYHANGHQKKTGVAILRLIRF